MITIKDKFNRHNSSLFYAGLIGYWYLSLPPFSVPNHIFINSTYPHTLITFSFSSSLAFSGISLYFWVHLSSWQVVTISSHNMSKLFQSLYAFSFSRLCSLLLNLVTLYLIYRNVRIAANVIFISSSIFNA